MGGRSETDLSTVAVEVCVVLAKKHICSNVFDEQGENVSGRTCVQLLSCKRASQHSLKRRRGWSPKAKGDMEAGRRSEKGCVGMDGWMDGGRERGREDEREGGHGWREGYAEGIEGEG